MIRLLVIFAFLGFANCQSSCSSPDSVESFRHPFFEDKYRMCINGTQKELCCAQGLKFSSTYSKCILPSDDVSLICSISSTPENPFVANKKDCKKYFICNQGLPIAAECADGLYFDFVDNRCTTASDVKCVGGSKNNPQTTVRGNKANLTECWSTYFLYDRDTENYIKGACVLITLRSFSNSKKACRNRKMKLFTIPDSRTKEALQETLRYSLGTLHPQGQVWFEQNDSTTNKCKILKGSGGTYEPVDWACAVPYWQLCEF